MYGRAIVRAYDLEQVPGGQARIVVDEEALTSIRPAIEREGLDSELRSLVREEGSKTFLDYLRACEGELNVPEQTSTVARYTLRCCGIGRGGAISVAAI